MLKRAIISGIQAAWLGSCMAEAHRFHWSCKRPLKLVQAQVLNQILANSENSLFAQDHGLARHSSVADLQKNVPLRNYDDFQGYIEKIAAGQTNVLSNEPVRMFELTSGSSSASKLIPYTSSLQKSFNRALHPWLIDLYQNFSQLWGGPAYWVITPKTASGKTKTAGIKIGFAADSEYFGAWSKFLVELLMAVPAEVGKIKDIATWKYETLLHLLLNEDLRLISLWNPGFITSLLSPIQDFGQQLARDLSLKAGKNRAQKFTEALEFYRKGEKDEFTRLLWPKLALISSWSEAEASGGAEQIKKIFSHAQFQTKGILATESAITIPLQSACNPVLAARSAFFEFIEAESGKIFLAHQLQQNKIYSLVITTYGGLYRYCLGDLVKLTGYYHNFPCFAFIGKEEMVSDLCGEKLNAGHIKQILASILPKATAAFIAPERSVDSSLPGYCLFVSRQFYYPGLLAKAEKLLCENFHYNWCSKNGQLKALCLMIAGESEELLLSLRLERMAELGTTFSTAKTGCLNRLDGWRSWFSGRLGRDR